MKEEKKINVYKITNYIFAVICLAIVGSDAYLYDSTGGNLFFIIHGASVLLAYLLYIFSSKLLAYFNEQEDEFGSLLICNILNVIPMVNFLVLAYLIGIAISLIIRYIENSDKFSFKP